MKRTPALRDGLSHYAIDAGIVTVAFALLLYAALGDHSSVSHNSSPAPPMSLGTPPPLTYRQNMSPLHADTPYSLDIVAQDRGRSIVVANRPTVITIERHRATTLTGWAVDGPGQRAADAVYVLLDGKLATSCHIGVPRADVAAAYNIAAYATSGFSCTIPPALIATGRHAVELDVVAQGGHTYYAVKPPTALVAR